MITFKESVRNNEVTIKCKKIEVCQISVWVCLASYWKTIFSLKHFYVLKLMEDWICLHEVMSPH